MDARELQKLWHELVETGMQNPNVSQAIRNMSFIISYLISEQDKRRELAKQIEEHSKSMIEANEQRSRMGMRLEQLYERQEKNTKLLRAIFTTVISGVILYLLQLAFTHKP